MTPNEQLHQSFRDFQWNYPVDKLDVVSGKIIQTAMCIWGDNQSIAFAEWCGINGWAYSKLRNHWFMIGKTEGKTTSQLYSLYLEKIKPYKI